MRWPVASDPVKVIWLHPVGLGKCRAGHAAGSGDDVDYAIGQAGVGQEPGEDERRQRRLVGRLRDDGTAGCQCRGKAASGSSQRVVRWQDLRGHAYRFLENHREHAGRLRHRRTLDLVRRAGVVVEIGRCSERFATSIAQRLAAVDGLKRADGLGLLPEQVRDTPQDGPAPGRRDGAPGTPQRRASGPYGLRDQSRIRDRHFADRQAGAGIENRHNVAVSRHGPPCDPVSAGDTFDQFDHIG